MKMTDIMKKSHSESKSENLDAILQKKTIKPLSPTQPTAHTQKQNPSL